ncbi:MAG: hypothetical protein EPN85_14595 [Bacteroidetes bacterium]|nr:MAG: hypothetical protein EPN85_14595 [Bacteroidota bacterium]
MTTTTRHLTDFVKAFKNACKGKTPSQTFDDFLTVIMAFFTKMPKTEFTQYEKEFSCIRETYRQTGAFDDLLRLPPILFYLLEVKSTHPDIMGDFFLNVIDSEDESFFLAPYDLCLQITELFSYEAIGTLCVLDTAVKSGRMLIAFSRNSGERHKYYGIESNPVLAKLAAVNMFIYGLSGEIVCAGDSDLENFKTGFRVTMSPRGIFKIEEKEKSHLWLMRDVFGRMKKDNPQKRLLFL